MCKKGGIYLKEITESDINNIWYVKALKELSR
jgi:hypothetical protein